MARRPGGESEPGRFRFRARTTIINNIPASRLHFTPLTMDNCVTIMFRVGRVWPRGTMAWWSHCPYRAAQPDKDATFVLKWARARETNRENGGETERAGESMRRDGERWKKGESGWHGPSTTAPQSSNEIWLEINHRGVRAHVAAGLGSGAYKYPVACICAPCCPTTGSRAKPRCACARRQTTPNRGTVRTYKILRESRPIIGRK